MTAAFDTQRKAPTRQRRWLRAVEGAVAVDERRSDAMMMVLLMSINVSDRRKNPTAASMSVSRRR